MDTTTIVVTILGALLGSGGILGGIGWVFRSLLQNKDDQIARLREDLQTRLDDAEADLGKKEKECDQLRVENKQLWQEKVTDARESQELAMAYIKLRERETHD